jgi:hypothetical protein
LRPLVTQEDRDEAKNQEEKLKRLKILRDEGEITQEAYVGARQAVLASPGKDKLAPAGTPKK